jgi:septal ring factor EnvC (AmiA/AmiB activator)
MARRKSPHRTVPLSLAAAALLALGACSSPKPPVAEMAVGQSTVDRASTAAAAEAPIELSTARQKIELAHVAMAKKDYQTARQLAEQAEADAALAEAKAKLNRSDRDLTEVRDSIRQLREQANRDNPQ